MIRELAYMNYFHYPDISEAILTQKTLVIDFTLVIAMVHPRR